MRLKRTDLVSHLAQASLFAVLLFLTAFSIGIALLNQQAVSKTETQIPLNNLYGQIVYMLSQEQISLHDYLLTPSASLRQEHQAAAQTLRVLLVRLQQSGDADDKALVSTVSAEQDRYLFLVGQLFAAVDAHDLTRANTIHNSDIDPLFDHIQAQVRAQADNDQADESHILAQLAQTQRITFLLTPPVFALGLLLVTISWRVLQTYRKLEEASQGEIARLEHVVSTDPLTGLGSHYAYQEYLARALDEALREGEPLVLALLNIDEFKIINDEQGHQRGDDILLEAVVSAGLEPSRVVLEITERSIVNLAEVVQKAKFLRLMGFRIALDDAGAGNAGLEMLSQVPVDFIKIDRAIVANALSDQTARSVFVGITAIARESHIGVVAEGIENAEMLDFVQQTDVHYVQGYLLGRPSETIPQISALQDLSPLTQTGSH